MSYCTLYTNQDKIKEYYNEINEYSKKYTSGWQTVGYVLTELIKMQWDLRRKYYNKNLLLKHKFDKSIKGDKFIEYLFQHIYIHSNSMALVDEIFEVDDAVQKIKQMKYKKDSEPVEDRVISFSLIVEEMIDVLFFICETTSWLETHYQLYLDPNKNNINSNTIEPYLVGYNNFSDRISIMIGEEGSHIATYIYDHKNEVKDYDTYGMFLVMNLIKLVRNFVRQCAVKDWKIYPDDYYNPARFGELFKLNRELYLIIINCLFNVMRFFAKHILDIKDYNQDEHISDLFKLIYACFKVKAEVNERRQLNDKNYNPENTGEPEGVLVK